MILKIHEKSVNLPDSNKLIGNENVIIVRIFLIQSMQHIKLKSTYPQVQCNKIA
jgi:hypothetical protein